MKRGLILLAAAGLASPMPAAAQPTGVQCVVGSLTPAELDSLSGRYARDEITIRQVEEAFQPGYAKCVESKAITVQSQIDSSFAYAVAILEIVSDGKELQATGIDPSAIEALWSRLPVPLRDKAMAYAADPGQPLPREELMAFVSANSEADEKGKLGTAIVFLVALARAIEADQRFTAAIPR